MLTKLAALQQFRQSSHLAIEDELLNFFLEDSATAGGAGGGADKAQRRRLRHEAVGRVGFDPYDESPVKRRGEGYIRRRGEEGEMKGEEVPVLKPFRDIAAKGPELGGSPRSSPLG